MIIVVENKSTLRHFLKFSLERNNQRRYNIQLFKKYNKVKCPINKWQ